MHGSCTCERNSWAGNDANDVFHCGNTTTARTRCTHAGSVHPEAAAAAAAVGAVAVALRRVSPCAHGAQPEGSGGGGDGGGFTCPARTPCAPSVLA